jgi:hydroxymethylpyrimidine/phosphomethylpyrimidine kinase
VTALTAQDRRRVRAIAEVAPAFVAQQLDAVLDDLEVRAAKTGMLHRARVIDAVVARLRARPLPHLVVDPVMVATSGDPLLEPEGIAALRERLLPLATLITPNLREAEVLTGRAVTTVVEMREAARALVALGARAALVKGGHLAGDAVDVLYDGRGFRELGAPRREGRRLHGTGCVLSAAITAGLARGSDLAEAVAEAKRHVTRAIEAAPAGEY